MASLISSSNPKIEALPLPVEADLLCGHCGQNLRGVASERCPECGGRFDRARIVTAVIPWEQRKQIGRFKAYWRTVRFVTFRAPRMGIDSITLTAAKSFRRWTVGMLIVTLSVPVIVWTIHDRGAAASPGVFTKLFNQHEWPELEAVMRNSWFFGTSVVAAVLWIVAITGVGAWFSHPTRLSVAEQKRGVAASYYACAPLAWITPLAMVYGLFSWMSLNGEKTVPLDYLAPVFVGTATILIATAPIVWWGVSVLLIGRSTGSRMRAVMAAVLLPILWTLLAVIIFFTLHLFVNYGALLIQWLR